MRFRLQNPWMACLAAVFMLTCGNDPQGPMQPAGGDNGDPPPRGIGDNGGGNNGLGNNGGDNQGDNNGGDNGGDNNGGADPTPVATPDPTPPPVMTPPPRPTPPPPMTPEPCAEASAEAANVVLPVDIIWAVDTSGSMDQEEATVEDEINAFVNFIGASQLDYHVIMIADQGVCVPAPLSGGGCPDQDSANYLHVRQKVDSDDALKVISNTYPQYQHFLRPNAKVHIVVVSDDDSDEDADWFINQMGQKQNPGFPDGFVFHSIVAFPRLLLGCCGWQGCGARRGSEYLDLSDRTGGVARPICEDDWGAIFTAIGERVLEGTRLPCEFGIPDPGPFLEVNPARVNVYFTPPGAAEATLLPNVDTMAGCVGPGWYYDNPLTPSSVRLCPQSCDAGSGVPDGATVSVEFGCEITKDL